MSRTSKRVWSGLVALAIAAVTVPVLSAPAASAAGVPQPGGAEVRNAGGAAPLDSGNSATTFTLRLPSGAACGGDSANDGYRVQSYIVPNSVDPSTLTFNLSGPIPTGVGASLRQPLFDTNGNPYVNAQTANATSPPGPGPIVNIPDLNYGVFSPGNIPAGTYNIGIACTLGPASGTQMKEFWNSKMTFKTDAGGGPAQVTWVAGIPAGNGCNNTTGILGATISWYPANPAGMSSLKVACTFNNQPGTNQVSPSFTVHDHNQAMWHNGAARSVLTTVATAASTTVQLNTESNGIAGLPVTANTFNRVITGAGIPVRTHVIGMTAGGQLNLNRPATIPAGSTLKIENGNGRSITNATYTAPDRVNSAAGTGAANFNAATDVGLSISGTGIGLNSTIAAVISATQVQVTPAFGGLGGGTVTIGGTQLTTTTRQITNASTTSTVRINSAAAGWAATDLGLEVVGRCYNGASPDTNIPANVYITTIASAANADTTGGLTSGWTECDLTIGDPSATAPANGDVTAHQGVQLDLNPSFVAGSGACADDQPEGFATIAKWYNPGSFQNQTLPIGLTNLQPVTTKAIGQVVFDTSVADFSAFVIERKAATPGDPIGVVHYDLVTPFAPTSLAMCPGTVTSPGLGFSLLVLAATSTQSTLPLGTGRPETSQVRSTLPQASGGYSSTAFVRSDDVGVTFSPPSAFQRLCAYPAGTPNPVDFFCGNG